MKYQHDLPVVLTYGGGTNSSAILVELIRWDERQRAINAAGKEPENETPFYPLIEWEMGRDECVQSLIDAKLPLAGKSSCFFCPNKNASSVKEMAHKHPELIARAIAIEDSAALADKENGKQSDIVGLGRTWRWKDLMATDDMFGFTDLNKDMPCGCFDGGE